MPMAIFSSERSAVRGPNLAVDCDHYWIKTRIGIRRRTNDI